jgi:ABC-type sugar transport system ATPase subunit
MKPNSDHVLPPEAAVDDRTSNTQCPVLSAHGISKRFGGVLALNDVSLELYPGEVHALCGENGAGKSTLMRIFSGVVTEYSGELRMDGKPIRFGDRRDAEHAGIAIVHQELNLASHLSVVENIFLGREKTCWGFWLDHRHMTRESDQLLQQVSASFDSRTKVKSLRIGDQQLVEIAKALAFEARVLVLDEPTSALAVRESERLFKIIDELRRKGVAIVYVSHKMDEIERLADRVTVLRDGCVVSSSSKKSYSTANIIALMVGRQFNAPSKRSSAQPQEVLLSVDGLSLVHPNRQGAWLLRDIRFSLKRGEILGVAGLLGAGRTELLECLAGAPRSPPTGSITLEGKPVAIRDPEKALRLGIGFVPEDRKRLGLLNGRNVRENLSLCRLSSLDSMGFLRLSEEVKLVRELAQRIHLRMPSLESPVEQLSGGNQQKCVLGRRLLAHPQLLLLDEPTRGVDVGAKAEIHGLLRTLAERGLAILMASCELPELLKVCDRILVLCEGRLTGEYASNEATEETLLRSMLSFHPKFASS